MSNNQQADESFGQFSSLGDEGGVPDARYSILMHATLVDQLDEQFSPMDGIVAIDQLFYELSWLGPEALPEAGTPQSQSLPRPL